MLTEGFQEEQIKKFVEEVNQKEYNKMNKALRRLKIYLDPEQRLLIKASDHLKMAVEMRKILRYWINFSNNRVQWVRADMQEAFRRWANNDIARAIQLDRDDFRTLLY